MNELSFSDLEGSLQDLIQLLKPVQSKRALRDITAYLRKANRNRIRQQKNLDGSQYEARKNKKTRKKMLTGFTKHIRQSVSHTHAEIGIMGKAAQLAGIHHSGEVEGGILYPERNLIGWTDDDLSALRGILLKHVT